MRVNIKVGSAEEDTGPERVKRIILDGQEFSNTGIVSMLSRAGVCS